MDNMHDLVGKMLGNQEGSSHIDSHSSMFASHDVYELVKANQKPIDNLFKVLAHNIDVLMSAKDYLHDIFTDNRFVNETLLDDPSTLSFFPRFLHQISDFITAVSLDYHSIYSQYNLFVKGRFTDSDRAERISDESGSDWQPHNYQLGSGNLDGRVSDDEMRASIKAGQLLRQSLMLYAETKINFSKVITHSQKFFSSYNNYLQDRFVNDERDLNDNMHDLIRRLDNPNRDHRVPYVKVKLMEGNPVLTDILLGIIDLIPQYKTVNVGKKKRNKKSEKYLSTYAVGETATRLAALSDPAFISYINDPKIFFEAVGICLEEFYQFTQSMEDAYERIMHLEHIDMFIPDRRMIAEIMNAPASKTKISIDNLKQIDLDTVIQDVDKVSANTRKEIDQFKIRGQLFSLLCKGLKKLSNIVDPYNRIDAAKEVIEEAAKHKSQLMELVKSERVRRLRIDKILDNEYYVGRQHGHGQFHFERKPVPDVKLDDVIGKSFDTAKNHLREVIDTGSLSRIMRLSAPGGKVRSNILLIGPYGCGKTELARAVCGDQRVIGASVSVANTLTAYMHESVNNVKKIYDQAGDLRIEGRDLKPVVLCLDEFDGWFANGGHETYTSTDMKQIENVFLEVLDGMEDYSGIITMAMTNNPKAVPKGIMRRFRYVDIVGQLDQNEREHLLKMYLERRLPLADDVSNHYTEWAQKLGDAPGDVVRKVVDEVHFGLIPRFISDHPHEAARMEKVLYNREIRSGILGDKDISYIKNRLQKYNYTVSVDDVNKALDYILKQPPIRMQIEAAVKVYDEAEELLKDLGSSHGFGFKPQRKLFDI